MQTVLSIFSIVRVLIFENGQKKSGLVNCETFGHQTSPDLGVLRRRNLRLLGFVGQQIEATAMRTKKRWPANVRLT